MLKIPAESVKIESSTGSVYEHMQRRLALQKPADSMAYERMVKVEQIKGEQGTSAKGKRSIAVTFLAVILAIVAVVSVCTGGLGIRYLKQLQANATALYESAVDEGYRTEIKSQVETSLTLIQHYYDKAQNGEITEDEAKSQAMEAVRSTRYREDASGYMWIDDTDYNLVMHPILPEQEGSNRYDLTDQNGVKIIQNIMASVEEAGGGYNEFYFTKADGVTVAPKLAYSQAFEPWGWVVTTGNYVDDMQSAVDAAENELQKAYRKMILSFCVVIAVFLFLAAIIAIAVGKKIAVGIQAVESDLRKAAAGNLSFTINPQLLNRRDEVGGIARSLDSVRSSLAEIIGYVSVSGEQLNESSEHFSQKFRDIRESILNTNTAIEELAQGATSQANETEVVNEKILELGGVINIEKEEMEKLESSVQSMMGYSTGASESIESLYNIAQITSNAVGIVSEQTEQTNESAEHINKAVELIKGIAEQTNLLSLNASIEAARAGEAGRGFAVVAEEIRGLAEESADSAKEIEEIVQGLTRNIGISVQKMREVTENVAEQQSQLEETKQAFGNLHNEIQIVGGVAKEIGTQTEILDKLKTTVTESVSNLISVVEESAASTQETSASMQILSNAVDACTQDTLTLVDLSKKQNEETEKFTL